MELVVDWTGGAEVTEVTGTPGTGVLDCSAVEISVPIEVMTVGVEMDVSVAGVGVPTADVTGVSVGV